MADDHDVLDLEHVDRELQHREVVGVLRRREIGDVAVDEQLAGIETDDLVGGHAAVGAADPQIFRRLLALQPAEEAGVGRDHAGRPGAVVGFEGLGHDRCVASPVASAKRRRPLRAAFAAVKGWWEFGARAIAVFIEIIAPIFGVVMAGWLAARLRAFDEAATRGLSLFAFNFAIPVFLLRTVAQTELPPHPDWGFVFAYFGGAFAIFVLGAVARLLLPQRGGARHLQQYGVKSKG